MSPSVWLSALPGTGLITCTGLRVPQLSVLSGRMDPTRQGEGGVTVSETARQRSARRSQIITDVYAAWVAEHLADNTLQATVVGDVTSEEHAELAFLTPEADDDLHRRTTAALRDAGF